MDLVLPCPEKPPLIEEGGYMWYSNEITTYKCPDGKAFANGDYPYWTSTCTVIKEWDPPEVEKCIGKYCC